MLDNRVNREHESTGAIAIKIRLSWQQRLAYLGYEGRHDGAEEGASNKALAVEPRLESVLRDTQQGKNGSQ